MKIRMTFILLATGDLALLDLDETATKKEIAEVKKIMVEAGFKYVKQEKINSLDRKS